MKKAFAPKEKSKAETKDSGLSKGKKGKGTPDMLSYGWANNHPTVPGNFMKTFNVKVPSDQVFQSTRERLGRIDKQKQSKKQVEVIKQPETVIKDALQQYLEAKKRLEKLQSMYRSEYQIEYVNWAEPVKGIDKKSRGPAGLPSDYHDKEKKKDFSPESKHQISVVRETASSPIKSVPNSTDASPKKNDAASESISEVKSVKIESKIPDSSFPKASTAYDQLKPDESPIQALEKIEPAGVSDAVAKTIKEKRHFTERPSEIRQSLIEVQDGIKLSPEDIPKKDEKIETQNSDGKVLMFNIEPPTTWRLAQDLLDRAHKRSQNLDKDN